MASRLPPPRRRLLLPQPPITSTPPPRPPTGPSPSSPPRQPPPPRRPSHRSLARLAQTHGPLISLRLGAVTTVVASSQEAAREFLQRHDAVFASRSVPDAVGDAHAKNSVVWLPNSPRWRALGKVMARDLLAPHQLDAPELQDLFAAGSDTSSNTVEWAMTELLQNPVSMSKVCNELERVIGSGKNIEESHISQLPYLQAVVKETFRLHAPAAFLLPRQDIWAMGRDANVWSEPEKFMPERFLEKVVDFKGGDFDLIPFGAGRRMVHMVLGSLLNQFKWKLPIDVERNGVDMTEKFGVTLIKAVPLCAIATPINLN
ncbi:hypothetical protein HU200_022537 [Digitaria exilis]|uniref:Cytochrome P450 n=1 Tax=Digitaria exilis TaxID=1010633 RepID=A0A835C7G4_9POAL|nr:hypothetical protein HU200_022537 [Digitaria exilis]